MHNDRFEKVDFLCLGKHSGGSNFPPVADFVLPLYKWYTEEMTVNRLRGCSLVYIAVNKEQN